MKNGDFPEFCPRLLEGIPPFSWDDLDDHPVLPMMSVFTGLLWPRGHSDTCALRSLRKHLLPGRVDGEDHGCLSG